MISKLLLSLGNFYEYILEKSGPPRAIMLSFFVVLFIGSILLVLPFSSNTGTGVSYIDALFTATSAVCVTGLVVVDTFSQWSIFGKFVIMVLIQIGGLGFLTVITMFLTVIGRKITLFERVLIQASFNQLNLRGMVRFLIVVVFGTIIVETSGALILTVRFLFDGLPFIKALGYGFFHSISAFCNAGFDIIGKTSLSDYVGDPVVNIVIITLIILGGLGFAVWVDLIKLFKKRFNKETRQDFSFVIEKRKLQLNTKIAILVTGVLIVFGFIFFFISEYSNPLTIGNLPLKDKIFASLFMSVSPRTAGFATVSQAGLETASKFMTVIFMFIGGSPSGTAGGIKTVTLAVLFISVLSVIRGKESIEVFHKRIPTELLQRALAVFFLLLLTVISAVIALSFTERNSDIQLTFMDLLYEVTSAVGTVGLSTGVTPHLTVAGKIIISLAMFMGRIGPITSAVALTMKFSAAKNKIQYPDEKVLIG